MAQYVSRDLMGRYTSLISGVRGATGVALAEVYELP